MANKKTHTRSQNNLFCPHRSHHSRHCFKPPLKPPLPRFLSVCSVSSVVSHGFPLKTPLLNKRTRNLPGLKPTLRFLARAIRGHVIPRHSASFRVLPRPKKGSTRNPVRNCRLHCQRCSLRSWEGEATAEPNTPAQQEHPPQRGQALRLLNTEN